MPELHLFDTNILVHLIRDDRTGQEIKARYTPFTRNPKPLICSVTDGELRSLALQFLWGEQKLDQMDFTLGYFGRVPIEHPELMQAYAVLDAYSKRLGIKMGKNDAWIAAAAISADARLVTTDGDFDHLAPSIISVDQIDLR